MGVYIHYSYSHITVTNIVVIIKYNNEAVCIIIYI